MMLCYLSFYILWARRCHTDAFYLINVYDGSEFFSSFLEAVCLCFPTWNLRYFSLLNVTSSHITCTVLLGVHHLQLLFVETLIYSIQETICFTKSYSELVCCVTSLCILISVCFSLCCSIIL